MRLARLIALPAVLCISPHAPTDEDGRVVGLRRQNATQIRDQQTAAARIRPDRGMQIPPGSQTPSPTPLRCPIVAAALWRRHPAWTGASRSISSSALGWLAAAGQRKQQNTSSSSKSIGDADWESPRAKVWSGVDECMATPPLASRRAVSCSPYCGLEQGAFCAERNLSRPPPPS